MAEHADDAAHTDLPAGQELLHGQIYMRDAKGSLIALEAVRISDRLQDELVRKLIPGAVKLSTEIAAFRDQTQTDVTTFVEILAERYNAKIGGAKGNVTLTTFDGCMKIQLQVSDSIQFGPELQAAKVIVDECLNRWAKDTGPELRTIVNRAFDVDKEGKLNHAALFMLLRVEISDERWLEAMKAIRESIQVVGSREYVRFYRRANAKAKWEPISLNSATA